MAWVNSACRPKMAGFPTPNWLFWVRGTMILQPTLTSSHGFPRQQVPALSSQILWISSATSYLGPSRVRTPHRDPSCWTSRGSPVMWVFYHQITMVQLWHLWCHYWLIKHGSYTARRWLTLLIYRSNNELLLILLPMPPWIFCGTALDLSSEARPNLRPSGSFQQKFSPTKVAFHQLPTLNF